MSSEISDKGRSAQELRDHQEALRRQRKNVEAEHETELKKIQSQHKQAVAEENRAGAAAINHVKQDNAERLQSLKEQAEQKYTYEKNLQQKRDQRDRDLNEKQMAQMKDSIEGKQAQLKETLNQVSKREHEAKAYESSVTEKIRREQLDQRQQVYKNAQAELQELNQKAQKEKTEIAQQQNTELRKINEEQNQEIKRLQAGHQDTVKRQSELSKAQLDAQRTQQSESLKLEREQYLQTQTQLKEKSQKIIATERQQNEEKFSQLKKQNVQAVEKERHQGIKNVETTRELYTNENIKRHKEGDAALARQTQSNTERMNALKAEAEVEMLKQNELQQKDIQQDHDTYVTQKKTNQNLYKKTLVQQKNEFDDAFHKNMKAHDASVKNQKELLRKSIEKEKLEVAQNLGRYTAKSIDPFYQVAHTNASISETDSHYIVTTDVPEHERDNVKVLVKDGSIVVQGSRRFQDTAHDGQAKISTNNFQTFRQEIPIERPVREKLAQRDWAGGVLTVKIPKA